MTGRFPDGDAVEVRYPLTPGQAPDAWSWLPGTVLERCGPDEWRVRVDAPELEEDGTFPVCYRAASELRAAPVSAFRCPCCGDDVSGTRRSARTAGRRAVSGARMGLATWAGGDASGRR